MKIYRPAKRGLFLIILGLLFIGAALCFSAYYFIPSEKIRNIVCVVIISLTLFEMFIHFPLYFASLSYEAGNTEIIRHGGVFLRTHQTVQYSSIQYTTVINTPFSGITGLNFLIFFVYGGQINLLFLKKSDAEEILSHTKSAGIMGGS